MSSTELRASRGKSELSRSFDSSLLRLQEDFVAAVLPADNQNLLLIICDLFGRCCDILP